MELKFLQSSTNGRKPFLYGVIVGSVFGIGLCLGIVAVHGWKSQRTAEAESMMHDGYPYRGDTFSLWKDENGNTIPFHIETAEAKQAQIVQGDAVKATPIPGKTGQAGQVPLAKCSESFTYLCSAYASGTTTDDPATASTCHLTAESTDAGSSESSRSEENRQYKDCLLWRRRNAKVTRRFYGT